MSSLITSTAATLLSISPPWLHSWLLYFGIQTQVRATTEPHYKPLHNICEYLNALHIYTSEARQGIVRSVDSHHFCSHVRKDLRQCLIYDSCSPHARLIGVEYMIPKEKYLTLPVEEQRLWHSHEFEVKSGMLVLPRPRNEGFEAGGSGGQDPDAWDQLETEAMREVVGLYGKTWHLWDVERDGDIPIGGPMLMGSLTEDGQMDVEEAMKERNERFGIDIRGKRKMRERIELPGVAENADSWWKEAKREKRGVYSD